MRVEFKIEYKTSWGQILYVCGSTPELGAWNEHKAVKLNCYDFTKWAIRVNLQKQAEEIEYYYIIKEGDVVVRREWGKPLFLPLKNGKSFYVVDYWRDMPKHKFLYTSPFSESFFVHKANNKVDFFAQTFFLRVDCPYVKSNQELILCGESEALGNWNQAKAIHSHYSSSKLWEIVIDASSITVPVKYKLGIFDKSTKQIVHWENGDNRTLIPLSSDMVNEVVKVVNVDYQHNFMDWKAAGVAIPVFSLRSKDSFGIGEFSDLKKMVDWAKKTRQKFIQILPINDTTISHTWTDSYPYNAISIYALHPIYLGLKAFPLKNKKQFDKYIEEGKALNGLTSLDYDKVLALKSAYCKDLYTEIGEDTLKGKSYKSFFDKNEEWLIPYACFSYFRDKYKTACYSQWKGFKTYNKKKILDLLNSDQQMKLSVNLSCFIQYLLHTQLVGMKEYAHTKGVVFKGDIPIGISRNSVDAWVEPHLFNLDTQTGAPPDNFSVNGQNWGFPTYNWEEMSKDNYQWWTKRFIKMSDYFDAYRIDHILGFFRIWEIPLDSLQGLLGHFSPALPFSEDEIRSRGLWFDEYRMTSPFIHENYLNSCFGEYTKKVLKTYLDPISWQRYQLKDFCNTQIKIKSLFEGKTDEKSLLLMNGLYSLCNEVLFVRDKREPHKYHPRITAQYTNSYSDLDEDAKSAFNGLYDDFFYNRHSQFWREQALSKLPELINATDMLVCGEDLGMIPNCVPQVMNELQILSLEIQRMPKNTARLFTNLDDIPYYSVCTTSTHDMSPIRAWWRENKELTQQYYSDVLGRKGDAPEDCSSELCVSILDNHLKSSAMLAIFPLQDWLSIDSDLRYPNPDDERINIPADPHHYWKYRMHIYLEDLLKNDSLNTQISKMIEAHNR